MASKVLSIWNLFVRYGGDVEKAEQGIKNPGTGPALKIPYAAMKQDPKGFARWTAVTKKYNQAHPPTKAAAPVGLSGWQLYVKYAGQFELAQAGQKPDSKAPHAGDMVALGAQWRALDEVSQQKWTALAKELPAKKSDEGSSVSLSAGAPEPERLSAGAPEPERLSA
ncbi:MAG: hypothetical protein ACYCOU_04095 [Sulfobacillus sp.]